LSALTENQTTVQLADMSPQQSTKKFLAYSTQEYVINHFLPSSG